MSVEELKPIIDEILKNYFNRKTRILYNSKTQHLMIAQNKGLTDACLALIEFCDDKDLLLLYAQNKIDELNKQDAEEVIIE